MCRSYNAIRYRLIPATPNDKTNVEIVKTVYSHYNPKPSILVFWCKFNSGNMDGEKSVSKYIARLRELSKNLKFGATLDEMLRDRLL